MRRPNGKSRMQPGGAAERPIAWSCGMKCANPRENVVQVHPRLRDFDLIRRRDLAFGRRLETCGRLPEEPRPCTRPRMRSLECCFGNVPPRPEWVQSHFR